MGGMSFLGTSPKDNGEIMANKRKRWKDMTAKEREMAKRATMQIVFSLIALSIFAYLAYLFWTLL